MSYLGLRGCYAGVKKKKPVKGKPQREHNRREALWEHCWFYGPKISPQGAFTALATFRMYQRREKKEQLPLSYVVRATIAFNPWHQK